MSRSSATTPASKFSSLGVFPLAVGRAERHYRLLLLALVALSGLCWAVALAQPWLPLLAGAPLLIACTRAFNHPHQAQLLRHQDGLWWLGQGNHWQLLALTGEALVTRWCVRASFLDHQGRRQVFWLWRRGAVDHQHRRLRVLLAQQP